MKIYLAGNFPQMLKKGKEYKIMKRSIDNNRNYRRLVSFYFQHEGTENVINAYKNIKEGERTD